MKLFLRAITAVTGLLLAALVWERLVVEKTVGPAAVAALGLLALVFVGLLVLLVLYGTRYRELVIRICLAVGSTVVSYAAIDVITARGKPLFDFV